MKKTILRILILVFGLNLFTACYGTLPKDFPEPSPISEQQEQNDSSDRQNDDSKHEESDGTGN